MNRAGGMRTGVKISVGQVCSALINEVSGVGTGADHCPAMFQATKVWVSRPHLHDE